MSATYPDTPPRSYADRLDVPHNNLAQDEPFVPVYARRGKARGGQGRIKAWMILTPVAAVVLGGIGAMMLMQAPEEAAAPLAEPALTAPVLSATPTATAAAPLTTAATPEPATVAPAAEPVARKAAPLRRAAPAPARRETVPAPNDTPRAATPASATPTGPQPYAPATSAPSTATLNTAPTAAPRIGVNSGPASPVPVTTTTPAVPASTPAPTVVIAEPVG